MAFQFPISMKNFKMVELRLQQHSQNHSTINIQQKQTLAQSLQQIQQKSSIQKYIQNKQSNSTKIPTVNFGLKKFRQYFKQKQQEKSIKRHNNEYPNPSKLREQIKKRTFIINKRYPRYKMTQEVMNNFLVEPINQIIKIDKIDNTDNIDNNFTKSKRYKSGKLSKGLNRNSQKLTQVTRTINTSLVNPSNQIFTYQVLYNVIFLAHNLHYNDIVFPHFYNVYVEEGNNHQILKTLARRRPGWRVVQCPEIANFIWTPQYRKNLEIRPKRLVNGNLNFSSQNDNKYKNLSNSSTKAIPSARMSSPQHPNCSYYRQNQKQQTPTTEFLQQEQQRPQQSFHLKILKLTKKPIKYGKIKYHKTLQNYTPSLNITILNHLPGHKCLSDKKNLFKNLQKYYQDINQDPFQYIPYTISISSLTTLQLFKNQFQSSNNLWVVKPGEDSNQGKGIQICGSWEDVQTEVRKRISETDECQQSSKILPKTLNRGKNRKSVVIQKYIYPLLYQKRKFDIRMYLLITCVNNQLTGYLYQEGYIRTCSQLFSTTDFNKFIHLTNDAIQIKGCDYGKYQQGNKLSFRAFNKWLQSINPTKWVQLQEDMKKRSKQIIESVKSKLMQPIQKNRNFKQKDDKCMYFQLFGLDFMIDNCLKLWLIQVNTNPALGTQHSRLLNSVIPNMLNNVYEIAVEPYIRPNRTKQKKCFNRFNVIYQQ